MTTPQHRDRQRGESDAQYLERVRATLERETGLRVTIIRRGPAGIHAGGMSFQISAYAREAVEQLHPTPLIRVARGTLSRAAGAFEEAAGKLATFRRTP